MNNKENGVLRQISGCAICVSVILNLWLQRAVVIAAGCSTVDQEGGAGDERSLVAHQKLGDICHLIRRARTARRALGEHVLVEISARAVPLYH